MFKPLTLYIGLRYTRAKRRTQFISFITLTSVLGIALGVTALITVLSVMNGFEAELRQRILGMTAHSTVTGRGGQLDDWQVLEKELQNFPHVQGTAPFVNGQVMVNAGRRVSGTALRGILPEQESAVSEVGEKMQIGALTDLQAGKYQIVLGSELATYLGVIVGDKVTVISPQVNSTPAGIIPRLRRFTVSGIFEVGMYEYDRNMAIIHIVDAAKLLRMEGRVSGLRLKLDDLFNAPQISRELAEKLRGQYYVSDWTKAHSNFFRAIQTEKRVMFIILLLIVAVAAFNIVSTLVMVVTDKRGDIAILKTQGLTPLSVMGIFITLGSIIGLIGTALGTVGGVLLALNVETIVPAIEKFFGVNFMAADVYYISSLPSKLVWMDVYVIAIVAFSLSLLATIYPAWQASRVNPAEVLRYE
ncbi:lipoprotein-releasing ABC transporter permease subunit [methanotrophic endosymbiont of Bathymodiolus puteoserpentis (Logatchev)]|jgi:lipoprotein-releasing system permease protein|uniref:lipoprotein-releasing ABC transporter permease subunit n=1 Tax=methanotrophic endosymbiont of Bathymodiolus puteoserpentis (Logatchev) TaxID=343235 RepID=UPI00086C9314|nr:lipoprotein-releasing ABC transporter permease subunit [methanotrophic endosymbiont of Bathymodiolus puteoserpentis (Logatchev)]SCN46660.1 Lipoprotein releasing system transmembrane protein LolC [methanotrophic endosymbiont of Bathymodiolus azoricus (Menez Gwen)]SHE22322.1 Lipoprotein releasing system transmembrane protein LolC [methanotrophic endosymbiont of Bathymodiolus puteoserpentis (Logatchev)]